MNVTSLFIFTSLHPLTKDVIENSTMQTKLKLCDTRVYFLILLLHCRAAHILQLQVLEKTSKTTWGLSKGWRIPPKLSIKQSVVNHSDLMNVVTDSMECDVFVSGLSNELIFSKRISSLVCLFCGANVRYYANHIIKYRSHLSTFHNIHGQTISFIIMTQIIWSQWT